MIGSWLETEEKSMDVLPEDIEKQNPSKVIFIQDPRWERRRRPKYGSYLFGEALAFGEGLGRRLPREVFFPPPTKENIDNNWLSESKERGMSSTEHTHW